MNCAKCAAEPLDELDSHLAVQSTVRRASSKSNNSVTSTRENRQLQRALQRTSSGRAALAPSLRSAVRDSTQNDLAVH